MRAWGRGAVWDFGVGRTLLSVNGRQLMVSGQDRRMTGFTEGKERGKGYGNGNTNCGGQACPSHTLKRVLGRVVPGPIACLIGASGGRVGEVDLNAAEL